MRKPRNCNDCGAAPGSLHTPGCDLEICRLCGRQSISCSCVYRTNGIPSDDYLEAEFPDVWTQGPTDAMYVVFDAAVEKSGGRLPWAGEYPGCMECREFGWWSKMIEGRGWVRCSADDPEASEDLNRLMVSGVWDRAAGRWRRPEGGLTR